jgi:hypothetical protein
MEKVNVYISKKMKNQIDLFGDIVIEKSDKRFNPINPTSIEVFKCKYGNGESTCLEFELMPVLRKNRKPGKESGNGKR